jgi:predicted aminopeptidase
MKRILLLTTCSFFLLGCQLDYFIHSTYHQALLMNARVPVEKVLRSEKTPEETKSKLRLVREAKSFAEEKLGLNATGNYDTFVQLDSPYVSYVVQAAKAYELKPHLWRFPFVGAVPYKGYFVKDLAEKEARTFSPSEYDTYVRGVSAFSLLGWLRDPIYSSMIRYSDED